MKKNVCVNCGWGRIIMAQTFDDSSDLVKEITREPKGNRDIAFYVEKPHVVLSYDPQKLFLDPSDTYRLSFDEFEPPEANKAIEVRRIQHPSEADAINDLYLKCGMIPSDPSFIWDNRDNDHLIYFVAIDLITKNVVGTVMGINHISLFDDPEQGSSLWCLAVNPQAQRPGLGSALVCHLAQHFKDKGCSKMDLSVIHNNKNAKSLYEKLGFKPFRTFALKTKNAHNEALFLGPEIEEKLNPYAKIIVDEARARGITVDVLDAEEGYIKLSRGGKTITCRESLTDYTTAVAMSRCQDKYVTHRWLSKIGLNTPNFTLAAEAEHNQEFLEKHKAIVIKPTTGEQGKGISVGVTDLEEMEKAIEKARTYSDRVLLESLHPGEDLRVVVINYQVVAAAIRKPAHIIGDGSSTARQLIEKQSRRRQAATGGESSIPIDNETTRCLAAQDLLIDDVIPSGMEINVRKTANLHTGGTIHDVTGILHPRLVDASIKAARHLEIPVVGLDLMIKSPTDPDHVIIEANERVGLANHEPQPTAQKFLDLLFPLSKPTKRHYSSTMTS